MMSIPAYTEPAVTAGVNALLTSSAAALLTVIAPRLTVIGPEPAPEWAVHTPPPTFGVDPTRLPLVEKSSLTRTVADAADGGGGVCVCVSGEWEWGVCEWGVCVWGAWG